MGIKWNIAIPCATQNEIQLEDAKKLKENGVKYIIEGANMPTTPEAMAFFKEKNIILAPAKAANAGGVPLYRHWKWHKILCVTLGLVKK